MDRFDREAIEKELYDLDVWEERIKKEHAQLIHIENRRKALKKKLETPSVKVEEEISA